MKNLVVNLKDEAYKIIIEDAILNHLSFYLKDVYQNDKVFIITDDIVKDLYLETVMAALNKDYLVDYVVVPHGEASKSLETYSYCMEELLKKNIRRNNLLIALGGGVIGDLCGFVAATIYRGVPFVSIPTTLLSQVDSSIGGKTGIDFINRKNIIGCFNQPKMVLIDPLTLNTLPAKEFRSGMGELIKHGAIGNPELLAMLDKMPKINEEIIYQSLIVKKRVVEIDEFDLNERMTLNFGHTFGHALELKEGYTHGEAVAIGMLMAIKMGIDLHVTDDSCYQILADILAKYGFSFPCYNYKDYLNEVVYDKKNISGTINFIFLTKIGSTTIYKISEDKLNEYHN